MDDLELLSDWKDTEFTFKREAVQDNYVLKWHYKVLCGYKGDVKGATIAWATKVGEIIYWFPCPWTQL